MVFRKGGRLAQNLVFMYGDINLEIVKKFNYLGIVFTPGGSFSEAQATLSGQALKAIFAMNRYLNNFVNWVIKSSHILDLFDKLILPILNYGSEVWGFAKADNFEVFIYSFVKSFCLSNSAPTITLYMENLVGAVFNLLVTVTL